MITRSKDDPRFVSGWRCHIDFNIDYERRQELFIILELGIERIFTTYMLLVDMCLFTPLLTVLIRNVNVSTVSYK